MQYFHSWLLKEKHIPENPLVLVFGSYVHISTLFFQVDKSNGYLQKYEKVNISSIITTSTMILHRVDINRCE